MSDFLASVVRRGAGLTPAQPRAEAPVRGIEEVEEEAATGRARGREGDEGSEGNQGSRAMAAPIEKAARPGSRVAAAPARPSLPPGGRPDPETPARAANLGGPVRTQADGDSSDGATHRQATVNELPLPAARANDRARALATFGLQPAARRTPDPSESSGPGEPPGRSVPSAEPAQPALTTATLEPPLRRALNSTLVSPAARIVWPAPPVLPPGTHVHVHIGRVDVINPAPAPSPAPAPRRQPAGFGALAAMRGHRDRQS